MTPEQVAIAKRPFSRSEIEWISKSERDRPKAYVSAPAIIVRLWDIFPNGWEWDEEVVNITSDHVLVKGTIIVQEVVDGVIVVHKWVGHGSGSIHKGSDIGDAAKGGGSYAIRKSASRLRIGEHLWLNPPRWNGEYVKGQGGKYWNSRRDFNGGGRRNPHRASANQNDARPKSALLAWAKTGPGSYPELDERIRVVLGIPGGASVPKVMELTDAQASRVLTLIQGGDRQDGDHVKRLVAWAAKFGCNRSSLAAAAADQFRVEPLERITPEQARDLAQWARSRPRGGKIPPEDGPGNTRGT